MVEHETWKKWLVELSKMNSPNIEDSSLYAEEFGIPEYIIAYSLDREIKYRNQREINRLLHLEVNTKSQRMEDLRVRSGKYVSNATKQYTQGKEATKKESDRADQAELELNNVRKQLEFAMDILNNREGGVSEIEIFLSTLDANTRKSLGRAVQKSLHPDKHKGVSGDTNRALNEFFGIVNKFFSK